MDTPLSTDAFNCDDVRFVSSSAQLGAEIDIIIVDDHSGSGRETWADSKSLYERLCHLYPEEIKSSRSRTLVFDYCATADPSWNGLENGSKTISEQAQRLLDLMLEQRNTWGTMCRPIIFITHGLGGLLVEEALRLSIESAYKKFSWIQRASLIAHSAYGVFMFSNKKSLGWKPREWDRVTAKELKPIECSEQDRTDVEAGNPFSKIFCHHHERLRLPSLTQLMGRVAIFSLLLCQTFLVVQATMLAETHQAPESIIFLFAPYVLYAVLSYRIRLRDRYQKHIVAFGLLGGSILSAYLNKRGTTLEVIIAILASCVTFSLGASALVHWRFPDYLANEEWMVYHMIKQWAENLCLGVAGNVSSVRVLRRRQESL